MAADGPQDTFMARDDPAVAQPADRLATENAILALGIGLLILFLILVYFLLTLWFAHPLDSKTADPDAIKWFGTNWGFYITSETRLLLLIMVTGALGSFIHTATSFADFVGNQKLSGSWVWWYILRPFIGMTLAAMVYVTIRAGFVTAGGQTNTINLYGVVAMAGMVGMFAKQATDKLSEVFDTLFKTAPGGGDAQRKDGLDSPAPVISAVEPATLQATTTQTQVTIRGSGFTRSSVVRVRDSDRSTTFKNAHELSVTLLPEDLRTEGQLDLVVLTPPPGGGRSSIGMTIAASAGETQSNPHLAVEANDVDGCPLLVVNPTPDEGLPAARGGVS
jgi:hypothetical protein